MKFINKQKKLKKLIWFFDAFIKGFAIFSALVGIWLVGYNLIYLIKDPVGWWKMIWGEKSISTNFLILVLASILGFLLMITFFFYPFLEVFIFKNNNLKKEKNIIEEWKSLSPNEKRFSIEFLIILILASLSGYIVSKILKESILTSVIIFILSVIITIWRAKSLKIGKWKKRNF